MDSFSNQVSSEDLLPADSVSLLPSRDAQWNPPQRSLVNHLRKFRFVAAWLLMAGLSVSTIWSLSWLRPQSTVCLSLIGAAYEDNLSVNHNVYGWNSVVSLGQLDQAATNISSDYFRVLQAPVVLRGDRQWDADWKQSTADTLVIFCSAHGAADEDGPYLLADEAIPSETSSRIRISEMLASLATLPPSQKKLLVLDAAHFSANWNYGVLHNDFARATIELNSSISEIPNLVVICASDVEQLSWTCETKRQTAFGHFFLEAIRGAADDLRGDGRLDAADVFQFASEEVFGWVQNNFQRTQTPILLPLGDEGFRRASEIELAPVNRNYTAADPPVSKPIDTRQIAQVWQSYQALQGQTQKPWTHSPARWRRYEKLILRFEQLTQVGSVHAANRIAEEIDSVHQQLAWEQTHALASDQGNLFVGQAICGAKPSDELPRSIANQLWAAKEGQHSSIWQQVSQRSVSARELGMLRIEVLTLLYERAMANPSSSLAKAAAMVDYVLDPIEPPPEEINFLKMLSQHLPVDTFNVAEGDLIATALQLRLVGEQAAVSWTQETHCNSAAIFPWIEEYLAAADEQRLLGEDLLFAEESDRASAAKHFQIAKSQYDLASLRSAQIRESLSLQSRIAHRATHFTRWIAGGSETASSLQNSRVRAFESLMVASHKLDVILRSNDKSAAQSSRLAKQTAELSTSFDTLESHFNDWWNKQIAGNGTNSKHDIILAASLPFGEPATRVALFNKHLILSQQHENGVSPATEIHPRLRGKALDKGQVQGRLALAMIGQNAFDKTRVTASESFAQLQHRVHVFDTEERWWRSMHIAGRQIQDSLSRLSDASQKLATSSDDSTGFQAAEAADFNRRLGFAANSSLESGINLVLRNRHRSKLFQQLAIRSWNSHWYGQNNRPFYVDAAERYLQTAASLWTENPELETTRKKLAAASQLELKYPARLDLTTETQLAFQIGIGERGNPLETPGLPVLWIAAGSDFQMARPAIGQRLLQRMTPKNVPSLESCLLQNPLVRSAIQTEVQPFKLTSFSSSNQPIWNKETVRSLEVVGFFRGQTLTKKIAVHVHATPDSRIIEHAKPKTARLAVQASQSLHGLYGTGSGALAIVLDASGSMGAPAGKPFGPSAKYYEATRALKQVLNGLPDGIQVSVWIFGQASGPLKTVRHAEDTIRRAAAPVVWNSADAGQAEMLLQNIRYPNVEPWNESPIVETLLAAKQDLLGKAGFKSVLLLTDGMDNRFETIVTPNPRSTVADALRQGFDNSGIVLNIIGFKVESKEAAKSREQFQIVESFSPSGKYVEVQNAKALAETLSSVLQQRVRYWIDDHANAARPQSDGMQLLRLKIEAGRTDEGTQWYPRELESASYGLWTNVNSKPFNLFLKRGDQLVVELARQGNELIYRRAPFLAGDFGNKPAKLTAGWKVAAIENRIINSDQLSLLVALEKTSSMNASSVEVVRPHDVWFELNQQGSDRIHSPVRWNANREFPVPAWRITAENWPERLRRNGQRVSVNPNLNVWWSPDRPVSPAVRFERGRDYKSIAELNGRSVDVAGNAVVVTGVLAENRVVEVRPGVRETQPCLVVQLDHATDQRYWIRAQGIEFEGYEERSYEDTGKYTGIFWPAMPSELDRVISALEIISLADLKRQSERQGCFLKLDNIVTPRADDVATPPLTGFSKK